MSGSVAAPIAAEHNDETRHGHVVVFGGSKVTKYKLLTCRSGHLHVEMMSDGPIPVPVELEFKTPEDIWDFAQQLLRGYDTLVGI